MSGNNKRNGKEIHDEIKKKNKFWKLKLGLPLFLLVVVVVFKFEHIIILSAFPNAKAQHMGLPTTILSFVVYGCETWSLTLKEYHKL
jgi:hypothetical protein